MGVAADLEAFKSPQLRRHAGDLVVGEVEPLQRGKLSQLDGHLGNIVLTQIWRSNLN